MLTKDQEVYSLYVRIVTLHRYVHECTCMLVILKYHVVKQLVWFIRYTIKKIRLHLLLNTFSYSIVLNIRYFNAVIKKGDNLNKFLNNKKIT